MKHTFRLVTALLALGFAAGACGDKEEKKEDERHEAEEHKGGGSDLTPFQLEHGIGPVTAPIELGAISKPLADSGKIIFEGKCSACHKLDTLYVGPALGEVTSRRSPAFIMNMILNPQEMVERHPVAKQLLAERMTFMANQNLTIEEARAVLEYLRTQSKSGSRQ